MSLAPVASGSGRRRGWRRPREPSARTGRRRARCGSTTAPSSPRRPGPPAGRDRARVAPLGQDPGQPGQRQEQGPGRPGQDRRSRGQAGGDRQRRRGDRPGSPGAEVAERGLGGGLGRGIVGATGAATRAWPAARAPAASGGRTGPRTAAGPRGPPCTARPPPGPPPRSRRSGPVGGRALSRSARGPRPAHRPSPRRSSRAPPARPGPPAPRRRRRRTGRRRGRPDSRGSSGRNAVPPLVDGVGRAGTQAGREIPVDVRVAENAERALLLGVELHRRPRRQAEGQSPRPGSGGGSQASSSATVATSRPWRGRSAPPRDGVVRGVASAPRE